MRELTEIEYLALPRDEEGHIVGSREKCWYKGHEIPDQTPLAVPVDMKKPEGLEEMMQRLILQQAVLQNAMSEVETEEEANDFDTGESDLVVSELQFKTMVEDQAQESKMLDRKRGEVDGGGNSSVGTEGKGTGVGSVEAAKAPGGSGIEPKANAEPGKG